MTRNTAELGREGQPHAGEAGLCPASPESSGGGAGCRRAGVRTSLGRAEPGREAALVGRPCALIAVSLSVRAVIAETVTAVAVSVIAVFVTAVAVVPVTVVSVRAVAAASLVLVPVA